MTCISPSIDQPERFKTHSGVFGGICFAIKISGSAKSLLASRPERPAKKRSPNLVLAPSAKDPPETKADDACKTRVEASLNKVRDAETMR